MNDRVPVRECQRRLLLLWGVQGGAALAVVLIQVAPGGVYANHAGDVLDWFLPTVVPTLSLMVGAVVAEARAPDSNDTVDRFTYRLVVWLSVIYLALVVVALLAFAQSRTAIEDLKSSGKIITALYGVVGIALGAFFVTKKRG